MLYKSEFFFFPVGQGLFSYGVIKLLDNREIFSWVYDCGTSSSQKLVTNSISQLCLLKKRKRIDVVFISHFDKDHVSGVLQLLHKLPVSLLVMPYFSSEDAVIQVLLGNFEIGSDAFKMAVDPVGFLENKGIRVGAILQVPAGKESNDTGKEEKISLNDEEMYLFFSYTQKEVVSGVTVYKKKIGENISFERVWDFYTHNRRLDVTLPCRLKKRIKLTANKPSSLTEATLNKFKKEYGKVFGGNDKDRNIISTFVYAEPSWGFDKVAVMEDEFLKNDDLAIKFFSELGFGSDDVKNGIFYTGDGFLYSSKDIDELFESEIFKGRGSIGCYCFQVMHHGSKKNFNKSLVNILNPVYSVFSSNPEHKKYRHPCKKVVLALYKNGPVQVDKCNGFRSGFYFMELLNGKRH